MLRLFRKPPARSPDRRATPAQWAQLPNLKGTIFVVTYGRSGSTLLQALLQTIPGAHITGENTGALEALFLAGQRVRKTRRTWGGKVRAPSHPWFGADRLRPDRFERQLAQVFMREVLQPPEEARWIGFKEVRYHHMTTEFVPYLTFCRRAFPGAFFVFNSRAAADVAQSKWWARKSEDEVCEMVQTMDGRFADFVAANPERAHHVFHEQTVADPASLQPLFDKLGEPLDLARAREVLATRLTH